MNALLAEEQLSARAAQMRDRCVSSLQHAQSTVRLEPLANSLTSVARWQRFMRLHVFAVWDFMSLLKRLQADLNPSVLPWRPGAGGAGARLINEIVLAEETDANGIGGYASHFETYRAAMCEANAETGPIDTVLERVIAGEPIAQALQAVAIPDDVRAFVAATITTAQSAPVHVVAASFLFGREAVLPHLFADLLARLSASAPTLTRLHYYFARHIEVDGDDHGPKALRLLASLCGEDELRWQEAEEAARTSLVLRAKLWRAVAKDVASA